MNLKANLELKGLSSRILYEPSKYGKLINIESPSRYGTVDISFYGTAIKIYNLTKIIPLSGLQ